MHVLKIQFRIFLIYFVIYFENIYVLCKFMCNYSKKIENVNKINHCNCLCGIIFII